MTLSAYRRMAFRNGPSYPQIRKRSARQVSLLNVSERDFLEHVETMAALYGWHGIHTINSKAVCEGVHSPRRGFPRGADHDDALGFPDLLLVHPARRLVLFVELKVRRNKTDEHQDRWLEWTHDLGRVRSVVWRPEDEQEILRTLQEGWAV